MQLALAMQQMQMQMCENFQNRKLGPLARRIERHVMEINSVLLFLLSYNCCYCVCNVHSHSVRFDLNRYIKKPAFYVPINQKTDTTKSTVSHTMKILHLTTLFLYFFSCLLLFHSLCLRFVFCLRRRCRRAVAGVDVLCIEHFGDGFLLVCHTMLCYAFWCLLLI